MFYEPTHIDIYGNLCSITYDSAGNGDEDPWLLMEYDNSTQRWVYVGHISTRIKLHDFTVVENMNQMRD